MKKNLPFVSVVIPVSANEETVEKCLDSIFSQDYPQEGFEVIVVDSTNDLTKLCKKYPVRVINADVTPGAKRNIAAKEAKGAIIALCDDDVTVHRDWLKNLVSHFRDPKVAIVGGPNQNPPDANLRERCSGYIFSSFLGSASMSARYGSNITSPKEADETDLIACNMAVRKSLIEKFGFPEEIWPNEENIFCYTVKKNGYRLIYEPNAIVWHHRRSIFLSHTQQVFRYGRGRGQMMKLFPDSAKMVHFLPLIFVISLIAGALLSLLDNFFFMVYLTAVLTYFAVVLVTSAKIVVQKKDLKAFLILPPSFFLHHCAYGVGLFRGLFSGSKVKALK